MKTRKQYLLIFLLTLMIGCGSLAGESTTNSVGTQSISADPTILSFEAETNKTVYQSLSFKNRSTENNEITSLAFVGNDCGAFSVYSIQDESDNVLYKSGQTLSVSVVPNATIYIQIQFSPTICETTEYTVSFIIYYSTDSTTKSEAVTLQASVVGNVAETLDCPEKEALEFYDEIGDPTPSRTLPALEDGHSYYMKVNKLSGYLKTTGGFSGYSMGLSTNLDPNDLVSEAHAYQPVFMPFQTDASANIVIPAWDECQGFSMPSVKTDPFMVGTDINVSSIGDLSGTILRTDTNGDDVDDVGQMDLDFKMYLKAFINNSESLLQDDTGYFALASTCPLTTGYTESNIYLQEIADLVDYEGETIVPVYEDGDDSFLYGKNLRHGTLTLVGICIFPPEDAMLSGEAYQALIESESYLFLQVQGQIVTVKE